jgi:hypothetical protein
MKPLLVNNTQTDSDKYYHKVSHLHFLLVALTLGSIELSKAVASWIGGAAY